MGQQDVSKWSSLSSCACGSNSYEEIKNYCKHKFNLSHTMLGFSSLESLESRPRVICQDLKLNWAIFKANCLRVCFWISSSVNATWNLCGKKPNVLKCYLWMYILFVFVILTRNFWKYSENFRHFCWNFHRKISIILHLSPCFDLSSFQDQTEIIFKIYCGLSNNIKAVIFKMRLFPLLILNS